jgi:hypothetical protein
MTWNRLGSWSFVAGSALACCACGAAEVRTDDVATDPGTASRYAYYDHRDVPEATAPAPSSGGAAAASDDSQDHDDAPVAQEPAAQPGGGGGGTVQLEGDDDDEP